MDLSKHPRPQIGWFVSHAALNGPVEPTGNGFALPLRSWGEVLAEWESTTSHQGPGGDHLGEAGAGLGQEGGNKAADGGAPGLRLRRGDEGPHLDPPASEEERMKRRGALFSRWMNVFVLYKWSYMTHLFPPLSQTGRAYPENSYAAYWKRKTAYRSVEEARQRQRYYALEGGPGEEDSDAGGGESDVDVGGGITIDPTKALLSPPPPRVSSKTP